MKKCSKCKTSKPISEFWNDRRRADGKLPSCKSCRKAELKKYLAKHPDFEKKRYWANPMAVREKHLKRKYKITLKDYDAMFLSQSGRCAICGKSQNRAFDVDHNHKTGQVRGLLCTNCNRMIGHAGDSSETLKCAAEYLESSPK